MTMPEDRKQRWRSVIASASDASAKDAMERVKTQLALAQEAMKALLLANGGAMIALFTFVGSVISKGAPVRFDFDVLRLAFALFVAGFLFDLLAYVFAFLSQDRFYYQAMAELERYSRTIIADEADLDQTLEHRLNAHGQRWYLAGLIAATASVLTFAAGCAFALSGVLI